MNVPLTSKVKILLGGLLGLLLLFLLWFFFLHGGQSPEQQRLAQLDSLVKALETYHTQYGFYPEPTAREETAAGFHHVWGYRAELPALASCTVADSLRSVCGGNIYDREGRVVGWKGTLTLQSAQNSIEIVIKGAGRILAPFSDVLKQVPLDPSYAAHPDLAALGFGEYVYAVRAPEDGAQGKGGVEYQLAATAPDKVTGKLRTLIRGNYFVRSTDRETMPPSLIGPGIILDRFGNPLPAQEQPLHVLLDGQQEGYPNPLVGEGEKILRLLTLRIRVKHLLQAITSRQALLGSFPASPSLSPLQTALQTLWGTLEPLSEQLQNAMHLPTGDKAKDQEAAGEIDLDSFEANVQQSALGLSDALNTFVTAKAQEVRTILRAESEKREALVQILSGALLRAQGAHAFVLLARDELIKYLDGEGIEEQSRSRASRKIATALENIPDLPTLFETAGLPFPHPFLSQAVQEQLQELDTHEPTMLIGTGTTLLSSPMLSSGSSAGSKPLGTVATGSGGHIRQLSVPEIMVTTVTAEVDELFRELKSILDTVQADLQSPATSMEEIDATLRRLARALGTELERIGGSFMKIADVQVAEQMLATYETLLTESTPADAIRSAAELSSEQGDFSPFLFSPAVLDAVIFEKQPGIPDISAYKNPLEAEYKGIPYPLP